MSIKCMVCRERANSPTTLTSSAAEMEHDGRKYAISVRDFHVLKCQCCGEIFLDEAANERLSGALRVDLRRLALDHLLFHTLDRCGRVEDADVPVHQPIEEAA